MIHVRTKPTSKGDHTIFLHFNQNGKWVKHYLKMSVSAPYDQPEKDKDGTPLLDAKGRPKLRRIKPEDRPIWETAEDAARKLEYEMKNSELGMVTENQQNSNFIKFVSDWVAKKTAPSYHNMLKKLKAHVGGDYLQFKSVNETWLEGFMEFLLESVSPNTTHHYMVILQTAWNRAMKARVTQRNPFIGVEKPKTTEPNVVYLTIDELRLIASAPTRFNDLIQKAFTFSCFTGLRISDIQKLKWSEVKDGQVMFRQKKSEKEVVRVPINSTAQAILDSLDRKSEKVFEGLPCKTRINVCLKKLATQVGIEKDIHFHVARHTFGTLNISNGNDLYVTQKLMGHGSSRMTERYAKVTDLRRAEAISNLPTL